MARHLITLLTDFGGDGPYAGAVRGVLHARCTDVVVVDISHDVPAHDVLTGAYLLAAAAPWFPPGTVHLAVVDPGVGTPRRAIAVAAGRHFFVGPDNGLFTLVQGDDAEAREIDVARLALPQVSSTFHGRDVFAPVAAALASGLPFAEVGPRAPAPTKLDLGVRFDGGALVGRVLHVDRFGNVTTNVTAADLTRFREERGGDTIDLEDARWRPTPIVPTYADGPAGRPFLLWGSAGWLEIALCRGPAAALLGLRVGDPVTLVARKKDGS
jgi:S-adenosylmethionine hydrolase